MFPDEKGTLAVGLAKLPEDDTKLAEDRLRQLAPPSALDAALMAQPVDKRTFPRRSGPPRTKQKSKTKKLSPVEQRLRMINAQKQEIDQLKSEASKLRLKLVETRRALSDAIERERDHRLVIDNLKRAGSRNILTV